MRNLLVLSALAAPLLFAQSTNLTQAAASIAAAQQEFAALQTQLASASAYKADHDFGVALDGICPTCRTSISALLAGKASGSMQGIILCCGPTTVPATPSGTLLIYITPVPQVVGVQQ